MTSSHVTDLNARVDSVDALRLLVADLQALAERLGLKERSRSLQRTLKATQERVSGPRAVVMLLAEQSDLKRRFMERLLGSDLAKLPIPVHGCTRLEYGAEAECTVTMPQGLTAVLPLEQLDEFLGRRGVDLPRQVMQAIRLPNPTLARGMAVIDTPVVTSGEPSSCVLESADQADAWVFVLNADHALSEASQSLLRRLPERASRLEIVVEGAEMLSGEARMAARDRLLKILREACNITEPRLTLVASAAKEGEEGSFWHGRFATFHSVMMLRGRERWLEGTRTVVEDALAEAGREIAFELKNSGLGLRHARLRLAMRDLDGLRARFFELGRLDNERPREGRPSLMAAPVPLIADGANVNPAQQESSKTDQDRSGATASSKAPEAGSVKADESPAAGDVVAGDIQSSAIPAQPLGEPTYVRFSGADVTAPATPRRGLSVHLSANLARLLPSRPASQGDSNPGEDPKATTLPWRVAGAALAAAFVCLLLWAVWPRVHVPGREPAAQWDYRPETGHASDAAAGARDTSGNDADDSVADDLPPPVHADAGPDVTGTETPNAAPPLNPATPRANARIPLQRPTPTNLPRHRARHRRHDFLGLGRVWHWIRHPAGGQSDSER